MSYLNGRLLHRESHRTDLSRDILEGVSFSRVRDTPLFMHPHLSAKKFPGAQAIHLIPAKPTMQRSNVAIEQWPAASHSTTVPELYPINKYGPLFGSCLLGGKAAWTEFGTRASDGESARVMCSNGVYPKQTQARRDAGVHGVLTALCVVVLSWLLCWINFTRVKSALYSLRLIQHLLLFEGIGCGAGGIQLPPFPRETHAPVYLKQAGRTRRFYET